MAWIEIKEPNVHDWRAANYRLVNMNIYKEVRWLAGSEKYHIWGIPKEGDTHPDEWELLYSCDTLRQVMREFRRIKKELQR